MLISFKTTPDNQLSWLGYQRMMDAIRTGEDLRDVLRKLAQNNDTADKLDLFNGALCCLLDCWGAMTGAGATVTTSDSSIQGFLNGSKARMLCDLVHSDGCSNRDALEKQLNALCECVGRVRNNISFAAPKPQTAEMSEKVLAVRLVSTPDRVTTQSVERDDNLEIVSTTTRSFDVVR